MKLKKYGTSAGATAGWRQTRAPWGSLSGRESAQTRPITTLDRSGVVAAGQNLAAAQAAQQRFQRDSQDVPSRYTGGIKRPLAARVDQAKLQHIRSKLNMLRQQVAPFFNLRQGSQPMATKSLRKSVYEAVEKAFDESKIARDSRGRFSTRGTTTAFFNNSDQISRLTDRGERQASELARVRTAEDSKSHEGGEWSFGNIEEGEFRGLPQMDLSLNYRPEGDFDGDSDDFTIYVHPQEDSGEKNDLFIPARVDYDRSVGMRSDEPLHGEKDYAGYPTAQEAFDHIKRHVSKRYSDNKQKLKESEAMYRRYQQEQDDWLSSPEHAAEEADLDRRVKEIERREIR